MAKVIPFPAHSNVRPAALEQALRNIGKRLGVDPLEYLGIRGDQGKAQAVAIRNLRKETFSNASRME
ncbi:hypothetical protein ACTHPH_21975 [Paenibacillus pasadenensis]|uniref:hypothetical protein n=1 Tax=Paenibacillus pasadenensis TaxID=217090 RepID=UPI000491D0D4|nr:hypothetical protein [Paenibacillus pasadenensis]